MLQANERRILGWTRKSVYVRCTQCQTVQFSEHAGNYCTLMPLFQDIFPRFTKLQNEHSISGQLLNLQY